MIILKDFSQKKNREHEDFVITIGNFDGIHVGHQKLIHVLRENSRNVKTLVITFEPHPFQVLRSQFPFKRLFSLRDQENQLNAQNIDFLLRIKFDRAFSEQRYDQFLDLLKQSFNIQKIIVGYDFCFGKNKEGTFLKLKEWCNEQGIGAYQIDEVKMDDITISSSVIKNQLQSKNIKTVNKCLGRNFYVEGLVIKGDQRGRQLGYPTANIDFDQTLAIPPSGVYKTQVFLNSKIYPAITNVGLRPTFKNESKIQLETHILNFNEDIYGQILKVEFLDFVREEKKFESIESLINQIELDVLSVKDSF